MKAQLVEERSAPGCYGFTHSEILVDAPAGRVWLWEGWGGGDIEGESYRWRHGGACRVASDATFASLDRIYGPEDPPEPDPQWPGWRVSREAATALGLPAGI